MSEHVSVSSTGAYVLAGVRRPLLLETVRATSLYHAKGMDFSYGQYLHVVRAWLVVTAAFWPLSSVFYNAMT